MPMGPATMILLAASKPNFGGGGQIIVSGVTGPGIHSVGAAQGPGDAQGATLTIENSAGDLVAMSSADGGTSSSGNRTIQYPLPATLSVTKFGAQEIAGELTGLLFVSGDTPGGPPQFSHVQVDLKFRAASLAGMSACP